MKNLLMITFSFLVILLLGVSCEKPNDDLDPLERPVSSIVFYSYNTQADSVYVYARTESQSTGLATLYIYDQKDGNVVATFTKQKLTTEPLEWFVPLSEWPYSPNGNLAVDEVDPDAGGWAKFVFEPDDEREANWVYSNTAETSLQRQNLTWHDVPRFAVGIDSVDFTKLYLSVSMGPEAGNPGQLYIKQTANGVELDPILIQNFFETGGVLNKPLVVEGALGVESIEVGWNLGDKLYQRNITWPHPEVYINPSVYIAFDTITWEYQLRAGIATNYPQFVDVTKVGTWMPDDNGDMQAFYTATAGQISSGWMSYRKVLGVVDPSTGAPLPNRNFTVGDEYSFQFDIEWEVNTPLHGLVAYDTTITRELIVENHQTLTLDTLRRDADSLGVVYSLYPAGTVELVTTFYSGGTELGSESLLINGQPTAVPDTIWYVRPGVSTFKFDQTFDLNRIKDNKTTDIFGWD